MKLSINRTMYGAFSGLLIANLALGVSVYKNKQYRIEKLARNVSVLERLDDCTFSKGHKECLNKVLHNIELELKYRQTTQFEPGVTR